MSNGTAYDCVSRLGPQVRNNTVAVVEIIAEFLSLTDSSSCDTMIEAEIPSYPGSATSLERQVHHSQIHLQNEERPAEIGHSPRIQDFKQAVNFLHHDNSVLIAAEIGDVETLEYYIYLGMNMHVKDHFGRNALHFAVYAQSRPAVLALLGAGVDPQVKDNLGMTPLSLCLMRSPSYEMATILFDYGVKILPRSTAMDTGLFLQFVIMCKPTKEEERLLKLLIDKGCTVNDPEAPGGRQALHFAAMSDNCKLINILISLGADLFLTNHRHETPKQVAATYKCRNAFKLLQEYEDGLLQKPTS